MSPMFEEHDVGSGMTEKEMAELPIGARVLHRIFGLGRVSYHSTKGSPSVGFTFDSHGLKELMSCFAHTKLKRVADATDLIDTI